MRISGLAFIPMIMPQDIQNLVTMVPEMTITRDSLLQELQVHTMPVREGRCVNISKAAFIPITFKGVQEFALIDQDDKKRVEAMKWRKIASGFVVSSNKRNSVYLHKFIFGSSAKHVNGNRMDNRKANLFSVKSRSKSRSKTAAKGDSCFLP